MSDTFTGLNINEALALALKKENITVPTEIQNKVIPKALENLDLIAQSETGTGKTLAYLLPIFQKIDASKKEMQAIVVVPTHELAIQILRQIERLAENSGIGITATSIIGSVNIMRQIDKLKERPHIIVGSAGRILELIKKRKISAHTIKTVVLDEADRMMDDNNLDSVRAVIKSTLKDRQLMAFSATISKDTIEKAKGLMKEPEFLKGDEKASVPTTIEHIYFLAEQRDKVEVLRKLVRIINPGKAIAFVNSSDEIETLTEKLKYHGLKADSIFGTNYKLDRKKTMEGFKSGKLQLLIASDIAARGLDIEGVTHIFNIDMPEKSDAYLHRVGRTGRSGNLGVAVSIVTTRELPLVKAHERALNIKFSAKSMYEGKIVDAKPGRVKPRTMKPGFKPRPKHITKK